MCNNKVNIAIGLTPNVKIVKSGLHTWQYLERKQIVIRGCKGGIDDLDSRLQKIKQLNCSFELPRSVSKYYNCA